MLYVFMYWYPNCQRTNMNDISGPTKKRCHLTPCVVLVEVNPATGGNDLPAHLIGH